LIAPELIRQGYHGRKAAARPFDLAGHGIMFGPIQRRPGAAGSRMELQVRIFRC
jgi:hypothetical protein